MSNKLTYIEARDKIWNAYFRDEIKPFEPEFCFCGTLNGNSSSWLESRKAKFFPFNPVEHSYSPFDYRSLETALLKQFTIIGAQRCGLRRGDWIENDVTNNEHFEEYLFDGLIAALEVLKDIHRKRGDFIPEDEPLLTKRKLFQTVR